MPKGGSVSRVSYQSGIMPFGHRLLIIVVAEDEHVPRSAVAKPLRMTKATKNIKSQEFRITRRRHRAGDGTSLNRTDTSLMITP